MTDNRRAGRTQDAQGQQSTVPGTVRVSESILGRWISRYLVPVPYRYPVHISRWRLLTIIRVILNPYRSAGPQAGLKDCTIC